MIVRWTVRTAGTPCPQTRQVLFGAIISLNFNSRSELHFCEQEQKKRANVRAKGVPKSFLVHQTEKIRTLIAQGSYFSLQGIILVFKFRGNKTKIYK
jgi:hypothetical protein